MSFKYDHHEGYIKCPDHARGHRTIKAWNDCKGRRLRREARAERREADRLQRLSVREAEPELEYIRRVYGRNGIDSVRVAKHLRDKYPPRLDGRTWDWALVVDAHASTLRWPHPGELTQFLKDNPEVMLPSELLWRMGELNESQSNSPVAEDTE